MLLQLCTNNFCVYWVYIYRVSYSTKFKKHILFRSIWLYFSLSSITTIPSLFPLISTWPSFSSQTSYHLVIKATSEICQSGSLNSQGKHQIWPTFSLKEYLSLPVFNGGSKKCQGVSYGSPSHLHHPRSRPAHCSGDLMVCTSAFWCTWIGPKDRCMYLQMRVEIVSKAMRQCAFVREHHRHHPRQVYLKCIQVMHLINMRVSRTQSQCSP